MKMREEEDKGFSWWRLRFWRSEVKNEGKRRRKSIYRIWIMKVVQLNKGEGVFAKLRGFDISLGH